MNAPHSTTPDYPVNTEAWQRAMKRIQDMSPWQRCLMDQKLVEEALKHQDNEHERSMT